MSLQHPRPGSTFTMLGCMTSYLLILFFIFFLHLRLSFAEHTQQQQFPWSLVLLPLFLLLTYVCVSSINVLNDSNSVSEVYCESECHQHLSISMSKSNHQSLLSPIVSVSIEDDTLPSVHKIYTSTARTSHSFACIWNKPFVRTTDTEATKQSSVVAYTL
jgi:hypothetical protein